MATSAFERCVNQRRSMEALMKRDIWEAEEFLLCRGVS